MRKYRIFTDGNSFVVQERKGKNWETHQRTSVSIDGAGESTDDMKFHNLKAAQTYIRELNPVWKLVKEVNIK